MEWGFLGCLLHGLVNVLKANTVTNTDYHVKMSERKSSLVIHYLGMKRVNQVNGSQASAMQIMFCTI